MRRFILTGHGRISEGMAAAVELILGQRIPYFNAYIPGCDYFVDEIAKQIGNYQPEDEVIIMTDMLGGRVNNEMMQFLKYENVHLICGMNLSLVIGMLMSDETKKIEQIIQETIEEAKEGICYCNVWKNEEREPLDDF